MNFTGGMTGLLVVGLAAVTATPALAQDGSSDIKIVLTSPLDNVDPCNMTAGYIGGVLKQNVIETLADVQASDSAVVPKLATSWERTEPSTWRFHLRENVKFQDGEALDANAVVASIARVLNPAIECRDRFKFFTNIKITTKVVDKNTVDISSEPALALLPTYLAQVGIVSPKTDMAALTKKPVGTGPYQFAEWTPTESIVLDRFDGYWGQKPEVAKATYLFRSESALRASMVEVGEADIAMAISQQDATDPAMDVTYLNSETLRMRMALLPPLNDIRVRKAFNLSVDKQAFIGTILSGETKIATQMMLPSINGYSNDLKPWPYDVEQAKKLIAEAKADGVPTDKEIVLYARIGRFANDEELLQALVQMWLEVGLNVRLQMVESAQWLKLGSKPFASDRQALLMAEGHDNSYGDAVFTAPFYYHSDGSKSELSDPQLDAWITEATDETGEERTKLFQKINNYVAQEIVPDVMLFHMTSVMRVNPRLIYKPNLMTLGKLVLSEITFKD